MVVLKEIVFMKYSDDRKIAIYSRKSKFTGKGESINNQVETCCVEIKKLYPDIDFDNDVIIYEDEGYSGKNTKRPAFQRMLNDVKNKKIKQIYFYRLDRISRSVIDLHTLLGDLEKYKVTFTSATEVFDTNSITGRLNLDILTVFAEFERRVIAERIRDNMYELAKTGRWLGGKTPTGYKSEKIVERINIDGKEMTAHKLVGIPDELELVKLVYSKFIEFNSLTKTETYFLQNRIKTKNGKDFTRFTIKTMLHNPVYMIADEDAWNYFQELGVEVFADKSAFDGKHGLIAYNKTEQQDGKANVTRDISEWIIAVGKHYGVISGADWIKAQRYLELNKDKSYRKPRSHTALLSGVLVCRCGAFMRPKQYSREYAEGERRFGYLCERKEKSQRKLCDMKNPYGNVLDRAICEEIKKLGENSSEFIKKLEDVKRKIKTNNTDYETEYERLQKQIKDKKKEIENLIDSIAKGTSNISSEYINKHIEELDNEIRSYQDSLDKISELMNESSMSDSEFAVLKQMLQSFTKSFDEMSYEEKYQIIRTFVRRVVWDGENIHLYFYGSEDEGELFPFDDGSEKEPLREYSK